MGKCLLGNCPKELGACLADPSCVQNLLCLQKCNGLDRDAESTCQVSDILLRGVELGNAIRCCSSRRHALFTAVTVPQAPRLSSQGICHADRLR